MKLLGRTTSNSWLGEATNTKYVWKFTASQNMTVSYGALLCHNTSTAPFRMVVYSDNAGVPNTLLAQSDPVAAYVQDEWAWATFPTPLSITSGTVYWIGFISSSSNNVQPRIQTATGANSGYSNADTYSDGATASFGALTTARTDQACVLLVDIAEANVTKANALATLAPPAGVSASKAVVQAVTTPSLDRVAASKAYVAAVLWVVDNLPNIAISKAVVYVVVCALATVPDDEQPIVSFVT